MKHIKDKEAYNIGFPIFEKLFSMKKNDLLVKLKDISMGKITSDLFDQNSTVTKQIVDDTPVEIVISSYDIMIITPTGIEYRAAPGHYQIIAEFNKFFHL